MEKDAKMTSEKILEELSYVNEQAILIDGMDDALVGIDMVDYVAVYDVNKCVEILMITSEMTREEAQEYFEYNILSAYIGDYTPRFVQF